MIERKNFFKTWAHRTVALLILLTMLVSLGSCFVIDLTRASSKEEIEANVAATLEGESKNYTYVTDYLNYWRVPVFDTTKLRWVEAVYKAYYNYEDGLPDALEHGVDTVHAFLEHYYDTINLGAKADVTDALISCYVGTIGDKYSIYRTASESGSYTEDMSGSFAGIGIQVEYNTETGIATIVSVFLDSPAEEAGFKVGDIVRAVDGASIDEVGYTEAMNRIRGKIGTNVTVTVLRGEALVNLTATRRQITQKTIYSEITDEGYGYVVITDFKDNTSAQFALAIEQLKAAGVKGIIFDLRNNPGGYVHTVSAMLSYILPTGLDILSYQYKGRPRTVIQSVIDSVPLLDEDGNQRTDEDGNPLFEEKDSVLDIPITVICNEYTASSAEIFTSAIRDYRNDGKLTATIVGTTTYKKGIMQSTFSYSDGSSVTLTIAYYAPPSGVNYHGVGVEPDVTVELDDDTDSQYNAAIEELEKLINANSN